MFLKLKLNEFELESLQSQFVRKQKSSVQEIEGEKR